MEPKLTITYDRIGDILSIDRCQPYVGQESDMLDDEIVVRLNPETGAVETWSSSSSPHASKGRDHRTPPHRRPPPRRITFSNPLETVPVVSLQELPVETLDRVSV
jgi:hypothetical protein